MGGIGAGAGVKIERGVLILRQAGRVAVAVAGVGRSTGGGELAPARRLGKLPDESVCKSTAGRANGLGYAAGCRRAPVIGDPDGGVGEMRGDVVGGRKGYATVSEWNCAAVDAGSVPLRAEGVDPCADVSELFGEHAAAFFDIEKDNGVPGEAFGFGGAGRSHAIFGAEGRGVGASEFLVKTAVEEDEESETGLQDGGAFAHPLVARGARRDIEPVAEKVKLPAQGGQQGVAGVKVGVKAEIGFVQPGGRFVLLRGALNLPRCGDAWKQNGERDEQEEKFRGSSGEFPHPRQADCRKATDCSEVTSNRLRQRMFLQATMSSWRTM